jgi:hypothetical protein
MKPYVRLTHAPLCCSLEVNIQVELLEYEGDVIMCIPRSATAGGMTFAFVEVCAMPTVMVESAGVKSVLSVVVVTL